MEELSRQHSALFPLGFAFCFTALWIAVCFILSLVGGWRGLAQRYRTQRSFPDNTRWFQNGQVRSMVGYGNILSLGSDPEGVYLGVMFLFRVGHPRLFLRWSEIEIEEPKRWLFFRVQTLCLGVDRIPLTLRLPLVEFLLGGKRIGRAGDA